MQFGNVVIKDVILPIKVEYKQKSLYILDTNQGISFHAVTPETTWIEVTLKLISYSEFEELRNFIRFSAEYRKNSFQLIPENDIDLGFGLGSSVNVRYWKDDFTYEIDENKFYNVKLKLKVEAI